MKQTMILLLSALLCLTACSTDDTAQQEIRKGLIPITLTAIDVQQMTRATGELLEGNFNAGMDIKVNIKPGSADASDYTFETGVSGAMSLKVTDPLQPIPYYPSGDNATIIKAWYPADAAATFTVSNAQNVDDNYKASDLMYGKPWDGSNYIAGNSISKPTTNPAPAVNLKFEHLLSKVRVKVAKGAGVTSITGINLIGIKTSSAFDSNLGTATTIDGTTGDVTVVSSTSDIGDGSTYYAAIIPDQALSGQFLEIVTDKGSAYYSATKTIAAGHVYSLNITVNSLDIGVTNLITSWGDAEAVNSTGGLQAAFTIGDIAEQTYTGSAITLAPEDLTVSCNSIGVAPTDYDVVFSDNIIPGTATVTVIGKNNYAGIYGVKTFTIKPSLLTIADVTNTHKSWVIAADGYIYHSGEALAADGKTGVAMIISTYNGNASPYNHGLAIALQDVDDNFYAWGGYGVRCLGGSDKTTSPISGLISDRDGVSNTQTLVNNSPNNPAAIAANSMNTTYPAPTGLSWKWHLPTCGEWVEFWNSFGAEITGSENLGLIYTDATWKAYQNIRSAFLNAGGNIMESQQYWLGTESDIYNSIYSNFGRGFHMNCPHKNHQMHVRAFLAF